jgi:hypothetical protein
MWRCVDVVLTDISEERIASTFRVEGKNKRICMRRNSESRCKQTHVDMEAYTCSMCELLSRDRYQYDNLILSKHGSTDQNMALTRWPTRSPDLTSYVFFLWGCIKLRVFIPPLPVSVNDLKEHITAAVVSADKDMLRCVLNELRYLSCDRIFTT